MADYYPFHPEPRAPNRLALPGSIDSQFHILGAREKYKPRAAAAYEMPTATPEALQRMHRALGIERGIIVQTTTYGEDHTVVLDALSALGPNYKACANALLFETADDAYLARLHSAGVRGARFSFQQTLGAVLTKASFERAVAKLRELGWYMKVQPGQGGIIECCDWIEHLDVPVLIDHMGRPSGEESAERDPNIGKMQQLLERGNFWVMLSLGEKLSRRGYPWDDITPFARALIDANPERCVWGSDWPHPISKKPPPNDAELLELLYRYVRDDNELKRILVDNPSQLFGFEALS